MEFGARWHGRRLAIRITAEPLGVAIDVLGGGELMVSIVDGPAHRAHSGASYHTRCENAVWSAWREVD
jgi:hypothetical protein